MKTAREFLVSDESSDFRRKCDKAGVAPTVRQVRKFRQGRGSAFTGVKTTHKK
jgi:hypothetical protein